MHLVLLGHEGLLLIAHHAKLHRLLRQDVNAFLLHAPVALVLDLVSRHAGLMMADAELLTFQSRHIFRPHGNDIGSVSLANELYL